jgi:hypothetical protein
MLLRRKVLLAVTLFAAIVLFIAVSSGCNCTKDAAAVSENETLERLHEQYKDNPQLFEAAVYAEHFNVTIEEALTRFKIADAFRGMETILETNEPETYAGLWIQHEPSFCVVIAFTRDGEETIKKYVSENLTGYVEIRTVKYTYRELLDIQLEVMAALRDVVGIPFEGGVYVQENCVEFRVTDRTEIDKAIEDGRLIIPECVRITVVSGLSVLE